MDFIQIILATIVTLGLLVTVHEYGHFWVARRCGVKVLRFSVGFGKPLYSRKDRHGTEFVVAAIPLGGYVKMLDEREGPVDEEELDQAFNRKDCLATNCCRYCRSCSQFLFAIFAYWLMFVVGVTSIAPVVGGVESGSLADKAGMKPQHEILSVNSVATPSWQAVSMQLLNYVGDSATIKFEVAPFGETQPSQEVSIPVQRWLADTDTPDVLGDLGLTPFRPALPPVVGKVVEGSPAAIAKLEPGDLILAVDQIPVGDWFELVEHLQARPGEKVSLEIDRQGQLFYRPVILKSVEQENGLIVGQLGVHPETSEFKWPEGMRRDSSYSLPGAFVEALQKPAI